MALTQEQQKLLKQATSAITKSEHTQRDVFLMVVEKYKEVSKKNRGIVTKELQTEVSKYTKISVVKSYYTRIFKTAQQFCDMYLIVNAEKLVYTNLAHSIKLMVGIEKHEQFSKKDLDKVRSTLADVWEDGLSEYSYNNLMEAKITTLKSEYQLQEVEGEFKYQPMFDMLKGSITKLTEEQLLEMMTLLNDRYDEVTTVEAA